MRMEGCDPILGGLSSLSLLFSIQLNADVKRLMDPELAELLV